MSIRVDPALYFSAHRSAFGRLSQEQVDGLNALLAGMADDEPLTDIRHAAYMLATAWLETAMTMQPIAERGRVAYFNRYDPVLADTQARRRRARTMGNVNQGDGYRYRGRGYVQLTWQANYRKAGLVVGVDLVAEPDRAMEPAIAYRIMSEGMRAGWFTGARLTDYIRATRCDYINARRIINGTDKAAEIAGYARLFEGCLRAAEKKTEKTT